MVDTSFHDGMTAEEMSARIARIPLGRVGTADEVAAMIQFLLLPASSYITGQVFAVTGGD